VWCARCGSLPSQQGWLPGNDYWMFPWNPFQERVFSLRKCVLCRPSRGHIFRLVSELVSWWPRKEGREPGVRQQPG
jgi:hypothetical protein